MEAVGAHPAGACAGPAAARRFAAGRRPNVGFEGSNVRTIRSEAAQAHAAGSAAVPPAAAAAYANPKSHFGLA